MRAGMAKRMLIWAVNGIRCQSGVGLPEAVIALALLAVTLNGLLAAQWQAQQAQRAAATRLLALQALQDFAVRWRLNPRGESRYRDALSQPLPPPVANDPCQLSVCDPAARATADIHALASRLRHDLPQVQWHFEPCVDAPGRCLLVAWSGTLASSGPDGGCLDASGLRHSHANCSVLLLP